VYVRIPRWRNIPKRRLTKRRWRSSSVAPPELEPDAPELDEPGPEELELVLAPEDPELEPEELDELETAPELDVDPDDPELLPDALAPEELPPELDADPELPDAAPELDAPAPAPPSTVCTQARAQHAARRSDRGTDAIRQEESRAAATGQVRRGAPAQVQPYFVIVPPNRRAYRSASSSPPRSRPDAELTAP
jgi:hypothetical protein